MSGRIASFASGSNLVIKIGDQTMAYATNLSFSDDVPHTPVGGIGSYSYDALEPLQYLARGSFSLVRYGSALQAYNQNTNSNPARSAPGVAGVDGNSMLRPGAFNPSALLISRTFDIYVYERALTAAENPLAGKGLGSVRSGDDLTLAYTLKDCRMTNYSITFTPGQLVSENLGFIAIRVIDNISQPV